MKIIIIILICLFFSLSITPINELFIPTQSPQTTGPPPPAQTQPTNPIQTQTAGKQAPSDSSLQTQVNMLSSQTSSINAIAQESKMKVDNLFSEIEKLKEELKKVPDD